VCLFLKPKGAEKIIKYITFIIIIINLFCSCNKKIQENGIISNESNVNNTLTHHEKNDDIDKIIINENKMYVGPYYGTLLYSEPSINSTKIKTLPQKTELIIIETSRGQDIVNDLNDYWYKIDTGQETGWVFGGYLIKRPLAGKIKNMNILKKIAMSESKNTILNENLILAIDGACSYINKSTLTVYEKSSKDSNYFIINHKNIFLFKQEETSGWYYLISDNYESEGFIYIYDISINSFYGNLEENKNSNNYYTYMLNKEYEIVMRHENIQRNGPLLTVNHNKKKIEFFDTRFGSVVPPGINYLLLDYYVEYDEILILEQYYQGINMFIFNLNAEEYRCRDINIPYFNDSRTFMISISFFEHVLSTSIYSLKIFNTNNGFYNEIYNHYIEKENKFILNNIIWTDDNNAYLDYGGTNRIYIEIGNTVNIDNNLPPLDNIRR